MFDKLEALKKRYDELTGQISDSSVMADRETWRSLVKEHADIEPIVEKYGEYSSAKEQMDDLNEMAEGADRDMLSLIEDATDGMMKASDFSGGGAENPYCSFHAGYIRNSDGTLKVLPKKSGGGCCSTTSDDSRSFVANQWDGRGEKAENSDGAFENTASLDEFLEQVREKTFTVSGMIFQDAYNLDLDRLKRCYICEVDSEYGMVPFCAYNLTDINGKTLYRK